MYVDPISLGWSYAERSVSNQCRSIVILSQAKQHHDTEVHVDATLTVMVGANKVMLLQLVNSQGWVATSSRDHPECIHSEVKVLGAKYGSH